MVESPANCIDVHSKEVIALMVLLFKIKIIFQMKKILDPREYTGVYLLYTSMYLFAAVSIFSSRPKCISDKVSVVSETTGSNTE